jgi:hypothetical protein
MAGGLNASNVLSTVKLTINGISQASLFCLDGLRIMYGRRTWKRSINCLHLFGSSMHKFDG